MGWFVKRNALLQYRGVEVLFRQAADVALQIRIDMSEDAGKGVVDVRLKRHHSLSISLCADHVESELGAHHMILARPRIRGEKIETPALGDRRQGLLGGRGSAAFEEELPVREEEEARGQRELLIRSTPADPRSVLQTVVEIGQDLLHLHARKLRAYSSERLRTRPHAGQPVMGTVAGSRADGENGSAVDDIHGSDLAVLLGCVVLDDAQPVYPQIRNSELSADHHGVCNGPRQVFVY